MKLQPGRIMAIASLTAVMLTSGTAFAQGNMMKHSAMSSKMHHGRMTSMSKMHHGRMGHKKHHGRMSHMKHKGSMSKMGGHMGTMGAMKHGAM